MAGTNLPAVAAASMFAPPKAKIPNNAVNAIVQKFAELQIEVFFIVKSFFLIEKKITNTQTLGDRLLHKA